MDCRDCSILADRYARALHLHDSKRPGRLSTPTLELTVGKNVQEMLQSDLDLELRAVDDYNTAIQVAAEEKDNGLRDLFMMLLEDEEGHVDWLEAQMHLIKEIGYERYLTMQMGEDEED